MHRDRDRDKGMDTYRDMHKKHRWRYGCIYIDRDRERDKHGDREKEGDGEGDRAIDI